jgi:hypothetical protein
VPLLLPKAFGDGHKVLEFVIIFIVGKILLSEPIDLSLCIHQGVNWLPSGLPALGHALLDQMQEVHNIQCLIDSFPFLICLHPVLQCLQALTND